jgi:hypothetical protein
MGHGIRRDYSVESFEGYDVNDVSNNRIDRDEFDDITLAVGVMHTNVGNTGPTTITYASRAGIYTGGITNNDIALSAPGPHTQDFSIAIFADGTVVSGKGFINYSDKRIKKDILTIEDDNALVNFRKLNPCTYSYIDTFKRGNETVYGFIAQEVKEVLPYACSTRTETVPNVYQMADLSGNFLILQSGTFDNLEHDLTDPSGNVYKNISIAIEDHKGEYTNFLVKEVVNSTTIELYQELSSDFYLYNETTGKNECFVFGQFVNNFHMLDKHAIWTVAAAATQEIDRQQQADKLRIAELETNVSSLQSEVSSLQSEVSSLQSQLSNVLSRLSALENP